jgi:hypothetical protein
MKLKNPKLRRSGICRPDVAEILFGLWFLQICRAYGAAEMSQGDGWKLASYEVAGDDE